jgi:hypothetical protein
MAVPDHDRGKISLVLFTKSRISHDRFSTVIPRRSILQTAPTQSLHPAKQEIELLQFRPLRCRYRPP